MGRSKELFGQIREQEYDIDCSGNMYNEPQEEPEYKCTVCDKPIDSNSGVCSNVCFEADMM